MQAPIGVSTWPRARGCVCCHGIPYVPQWISRPVPRIHECVVMFHGVCLFVCVSITHSHSLSNSYFIRKSAGVHPILRPLSRTSCQKSAELGCSKFGPGLQGVATRTLRERADSKHAPHDVSKQARICLEHGICPTPSSLRLLRQLHLRRLSLKPIRPKRPWTAHTWPM